MATLYDMPQEWQEVYQMFYDPDVPEDAIFDTLESLEAEMDLKIEYYGKVIKNFESDILGMDAEIKRLQDKKRTATNAIARMKLQIMTAMQTTGRAKINTPLFTFSIQKNGGKAPVRITGDVPPEWLKPGAPDTTAIGEALVAGKNLPFAELGERGESLRIR